MNTSFPPPPSAKQLLLSVVVPLLNEEAVIQLTHERIGQVLGGRTDFELEIVYVDDGSKDGSSALLSEIADSDPRVCVITLSRNFGHQPAVTAGLRHASGDIVAVIDADLQDPVELIPEMIGKWREGYSVVYGIRRTREGSRPLVLGYSVFYRLLSRISQIEVPKDSGDFCLMDRAAVDAINQLPEKNRFVRGLRAWYGGKQVGIPYDRPERAAGSTRYSFGKLLNLAFDGVLSFSVLPLQIHFLARPLLIDDRTAGISVFSAPSDHWLPHFRSYTGGRTGLHKFDPVVASCERGSASFDRHLGEYLGRIYLEVKNRPEYVISPVSPE